MTDKAVLADRILRQLDEAAETYRFPAFDNAHYPAADARLTAFRGSREWLLVFQVIAAAVSQGRFVNNVYAFGNEIERPGLQDGIEIISESPYQKMWDEDMEFVLDLHGFEVMINGRRRAFAPTQADYGLAGIDLQSSDEPMLLLLRWITSEIGGELFLDDKSLLAACGRSGAELHRFLEVDDWRHPDVVSDEKPSSTPCLTSLAHALERNDPRLYVCREETFNTHWTFWQ